MGRPLSAMQSVICSALVLGALLFTSLACNAQLASEGWPKFRGNMRNTGLSTCTGPRFDSLGWTFGAEGEIVSSPAVAPNGTIYVTSRDRYLYAVNPDGTMAWRYLINTSGAYSSPAIGTDGTIYVGSDDYFVYALNPDGTLKWRRGLGTQLTSSIAIGTDGRIFIGTSGGRLYGLNPNGTVNWSYLTGGSVVSCAAIGSDGTVYFTSKESYIYAMSPSGTFRWRMGTAGRVESSPAISSDGTIYFGCDNGKLYAQPLDGSPGWSYLTGSAIRSSPAIGPDGTIYVGSDDHYIYAFRTDGTLKWRYGTGGIVRSSPIVGGDGIVYVGSQDQYIYALDPDGTLRWRYHTEGQVDASAAIGPGSRLYSASHDGKLYMFKSDLTPPTRPVVIDDGIYSTSSNLLHATWECTDPESGIAEYMYAVGTQPESADLVNWTSASAATEITRNDLVLANGMVYFFTVRARNSSDLWSGLGTSDGILVDFTAPVTPAVEDDGAFSTSADTLHASWSASDTETDIAEYEYCIGTEPGLGNVASWTSVGTSTEVTRTGLGLTSGSSYYFAVKARNKAGLRSQTGISDGIMAELTPPDSPVVTDDGDYTSDTSTLHAVWTADDLESGVEEYQYAVGTSAGGVDVVGWTPVGTSKEATVSGLSLTDGRAYYFTVRARNCLGMWSGSASSNGITVDLTRPSMPVVTDEGDCTYSFDTLRASWESADPQSGIAEYRYAIGTAPGGTNTADWTSAGTASEVNRTGLALTDGVTYYFTVKARNGAGVWSDAGGSDGILCVPSSVWPKFRADSGNRGVSEYAGSQRGALLWQFPTLGWVESSPAIAGDGTVYVGSGDGSLYAISPGGELQWLFDSGGPVDSCPAIGPHGEIYFGSYDGNLYCLGANGSFRWSYHTDNMIWSSPLIGPDGTVYVGSHDGYLHAVRPDGILRWRFRTGGSVWSSPALDNGGILYFGSSDNYVYAVYADTGEMKWKYRTDTAVDASPSIAPDGTVYVGSGDGYFYALNPNGTLKWRFYTLWVADSSAAVAPDGTVYVGAGHNWTHGVLLALTPDGRKKWSFEVSGEVKSSPAVDAVGTIYFGAGDGYVYALNPDGMMKWRYHTGAAVLSSAAIGRDGTVCIGSSTGSVYAFKDDGISDDTPPTKPIVADEGAGTTSTRSLSASWTCSDPETGITEYTYAIGTLPTSDGVVPWTSAGTATSVTRSDLHLAQGTTYYFSVKARNAARMWSSIGVSDGIVAVCSENIDCVGRSEELQDGELVYLVGKVTAASFADCFYIEEPDRSAGIKVIPNGQPIPSEGRSVMLVGSLATDNGEAAVRLNTIVVDGSVAVPRPIGMLGRTACLGPQTDHRPGTAPILGLEAIGMLVTIRGRVTASSAGSFFIDDGTGVTDPSGIAGIKIRADGLFPGRTIVPPVTGNWVRVTGILSIERAGTDFRRVVRPRSQADVISL